MVLVLLSSSLPVFAQQYEPLEGRTIKAIRINGLRYTPESRVRRQIVSEPGRQFSEANLRKDLEYLDRLAVFSALDARALPEEGGVAIEFNLDEISRIFPYPSIEITGESGVAIGGGVKWANPGDVPAHLSTYVQGGGTTNSETLFTSQWRLRDPLRYHTRFMWRNRFNETDNFDENAFDPQLYLGRYFSNAFSAGALIKLFSISSNQDGITNNPSNRDFLYAPGFFAAYDNRNSWFMPTRGWQNSLDVTRSFGDGEFWRADIDLRRYQPIADRHTLALFSLMTLQSGVVGVGKDIPVYADFHIGGTNSQRGWEFDSRHGKNQMLNTLEYRYTLVKPKPLRFRGLRLRAGLQLAAFGDLSTAWNEGDDFSRNFIGGGGVGLRILIPWVQMIRLDFGWGQSGESIIPHIGAFEKAYEQRKRVR